MAKKLSNKTQAKRLRAQARELTNQAIEFENADRRAEMEAMVGKYYAVVRKRNSIDSPVRIPGGKPTSQVFHAVEVMKGTSLAVKGAYSTVGYGDTLWTMGTYFFIPRQLGDAYTLVEITEEQFFAVLTDIYRLTQITAVDVVKIGGLVS